MRIGDVVFCSRSVFSRHKQHLEEVLLVRRAAGHFFRPVAVGIAVARYPPHRSVRADFPHPAPTSDDGVRANGSTHALQPLGHASAALCRSHVWLSDVLLRLRPSLQALRGWLPSLVRTLHWYYPRVRLLARVPVGLPALAFSHPSAAQLRRRCRPGLPVLVHDVSGRARGLLDCAGSRGDFVLAPPFVWSSPFVIGSTPWNFSFTAQYPARPCPCLRFALSLTTDGARLGVRMGHYSFTRSEERRVGKECRSRWSPY